jgi:hypothetical protein
MVTRKDQSLKKGMTAMRQLLREVIVSKGGSELLSETATASTAAARLKD